MAWLVFGGGGAKQGEYLRGATTAKRKLFML